MKLSNQIEKIEKLIDAKNTDNTNPKLLGRVKRLKMAIIIT